MASPQRKFLSIGECMLEFTETGEGNWQLGFAGDTLNTAWYFRALSGHGQWETAYFTRLGEDRFSDRMLAYLEGNGISTRYVFRDPQRQPGLYLIATEKGERSFTYWRSQSAARQLADDGGALARAMAEAEVIYLSGITLAILEPEKRILLIEMAGREREKGKLIAFDPNLRPRLWESGEAMRAAVIAAASVASLVLPGFDDEVSAFSDDTLEVCARRYLEAGAQEVAVKNGGKEMLIAAGGSFSRLAGLGQVSPVDTTGAGDSFNGAYLAARLSGATPEQAARAGHALASQVVQWRGALMPMDRIAPKTGAY